MPKTGFIRTWMLLPAVAGLLVSSAHIVYAAQEAGATLPATLSYDDMVKKVQGGDLSINFADLRMKYAASPKYEPEEGSDQIKEMYGKLNAKDFKGALDEANAVLAKQYVNIDAHVVASFAAAGLQDDAAGKLHHDIAVGLARSILDSSDGASTDTAYKVISVQEEYAIMRLMGWMPGKQSYLSQRSRTYDKMEMIDRKDNSAVTRYFDVTLSDQAMMKSLRK